MKFDFEDNSDPPSLEEFKGQLIVQLLKRAFWENEPPMEINMLKLPIIMAPGLLAKQVNSDVSKDSLLDNSVKHSKETMREFVKMVDNKGKAFKPILFKFFNTII